MSGRQGKRWLIGLAATMLVAAGLAPVARGSEIVPPSAPRNVTAAGGDGFAIVTWLLPLDDGGSPILGYVFSNIIQGVVIYTGPFPYRPGPESTVILDEDDFVLNTMDVLSFEVAAVNEAGMGAFSERSNEIAVFEGAVAPQVTLTELPADGGTVSTDPAGTVPNAANPVITSVTVPPTASGGTVSIAESVVRESAEPVGYQFLGQDVVIHSTVPTDAEHPLALTFRVDPALVPVTIFRNGVPVTDSCTGGIASPSPCIASGTGSSEITVLTAEASTWNVGIPTYAFTGFSSPVDNLPVTNLAKAGRAIPVRFGLGGDRSLNIFASGSPRSRQVSCAGTGSLDAVEETLSSAGSLSYSQGTDLYQLGWNTDRAWAGTCRELILGFRDGSEARAIFSFR